MLFIEGQQPRGVFVLCAGKAKLSTSSREGKTIITKISDSGDILGLNGVVSNRPYEVTAEMMEPGQANFVPRDSFLHMLKDFPEVAMRVAQQLSRTTTPRMRRFARWDWRFRRPLNLPSCCFRGRPRPRKMTDRRR